MLTEVIFGYAPFVSQSLEELTKKILDETPVTVFESNSLNFLIYLRPKDSQSYNA